MERELRHEPQGWACNMGWAVYQDGKEVYRGPEWAARLYAEKGPRALITMRALLNRGSR